MKRHKSLSAIFMLATIATMTSTPCLAQEIFIYPQTGKEYIFLGSLSPDGDKGKFIENGEIHWMEMDDMQQTNLLLTEAFLETVFSQNLQFEMEGYEPFWKAELAKDSLIFFDSKTAEETTYPIRIIPNSCDGNNHIYFMFEGRQGHVFGLVNYAWSMDPAHQEYCEYRIVDGEKLLYSVFLAIGDKTYKGYAGIRTFAK